MRFLASFVFIWAIVVSSGTPLFAQSPPPASPLKVGAVNLPPMVIDDGDGTWSGIGIQIWEQLAAKLQIGYEIVNFSDHTALVKALQSGSIDLAVPGLPVSSLALTDVEFTQPYFSSNLAAAVAPARWRLTWVNSLTALLNTGILEFTFALMLLLTSGGLAIWLCERRKNPEEFGGSIAQGVGHGIWWSAVTMTTVGYGDKAPRTMAGRVVAILWMFLGFILLSLFVSAMVSNINSEVANGNQALRDLRDMRVGAVTGSPALQYLQSRNIPVVEFNSFSLMAQDFRSHKIDALFADAVHLQHIDWRPLGFEPLIISQNEGCNWYAFALKRDSPLVVPLNREILNFIQDPKWADIINSQSGKFPLPVRW